MSKKWLKEDVELLKTCTNMRIEDIQKLFPNRTKEAIRTKCVKLKIKIYKKGAWTDEEISILLNNDNLTMPELLKLLPNRTSPAITQKAFEHKINIKNRRDWTDEEINIVNGAHNKLTLSETLALLPNRTKYALKHYAGYNNIKFKRPTVWHDSDIELLKDVCSSSITLDEVCSMIPHINKPIILKKINELGLRPFVSTFFKDWTMEEEKYLIDNYYKVKSKDLAEYFNVVPSAITNKAKSLGLDKKLIQIPYTEEELKILDSIKNDCLSLREILELFSDRTEPSLRYMLKKLEIKYNREDYYSSDGKTKLRSIQERDVFDFIRNNFNTDIATTTKKIHNKKIGEKYIPDFIIRKYNNFILDKKLIIEYYGLYNLNKKSWNVYVGEYIDKTHRKNEFYKNNKNIYFIDLYPDDIKNNFEGVRNKLTSFFMSNFNTDLFEFKEAVNL